jgi:hypothetical protein
MGARLARHAKAVVVVCVAVVAAVTGTALAGPEAQSSALTKGKVKKIVRQQIAQLAPTLHVASADSATRADSAASADTARTAESATSAATATSAGTADRAQTAGNAEALGGSGAASFGSGFVFGTAAFPGPNGGEDRTPYGITSNASGPPAIAPIAMKFRDFEAIARGFDSNDSIQIALSDSGGPFNVPLCTIDQTTPDCQAPPSISVPDGTIFVLTFIWSNLDAGDRVDFAYRLTP